MVAWQVAEQGEDGNVVVENEIAGMVTRVALEIHPSCTAAMQSTYTPLE